jgi:hypothetical protein
MVPEGHFIFVPSPLQYEPNGHRNHSLQSLILSGTFCTVLFIKFVQKRHKTLLHDNQDKHNQDNYHHHHQ